MRVDVGPAEGDTSVWEYLYEVYDPYNIRNVSNGTITYGSLKEAQKHYGKKSTYTLGSGKSKEFFPPEEIEEGLRSDEEFLLQEKVVEPSVTWIARSITIELCVRLSALSVDDLLTLLKK
jgi:hypothetical protein